MRERREVYYSGHVQGVGFRYTTATIARGHEVTGFVKNLPDGRVQLLVEGDRAAVQAFMAEISERLGGYIRGLQQDVRPATGQFTDFTIAY